MVLAHARKEAGTDTKKQFSLQTLWPLQYSHNVSKKKKVVFSYLSPVVFLHIMQEAFRIFLISSSS